MERRIEPSSITADNAAANNEHNFIKNHLGRVLAAVSLVTAGGLGAFEFNTAGADGAPTQSNQPNVEMTIASAQVSASDIVNDKITIVADEHIKDSNVNKRNDGCFWTDGKFWNSGKNAEGKIVWFLDPKSAELCRDPKSPTGWVKVAGGTTGRDCGNEAKPFGPAPAPVAKEVEILTTLNRTVKLAATATVEVNEPCGSAEASATSTEDINLKGYLKSNQAGETEINTELYGKATAKAEAKVTCETPTPPAPPTPPVTTTIPYTTTTTTTTTPPVTLSITQESTAEALYPDSSEQLSVDVSASNGTTPNVTWSVSKTQGNGEGSISSTGYEDQDGNPDHVDDMFYNGSSVGQTYVIAEATDGNATPVYTEFDIATQQDSGF